MAIERLDNDLDSLGGHGRAEERDLSLPPHSIQAEEAVLGSVLKNPASIVRVSDFLRPEEFYQQQLYEEEAQKEAQRLSALFPKMSGVPEPWPYESAEVV